MSNHTEIVRLLISHRADPTLRTLSGLTAADIARSKEVVRIIQRCEQHRRSQRVSSSHRRVNSVTSFKSLRTQVSLSPADADTSSDEPGPENAWHYLSPFSTKATTPPPAYDELFPRQGDLDAKRTSAAQAAANAVADAKCAALFDQAESSVTTSAGATTVAGATATVEDKDESRRARRYPRSCRSAARMPSPRNSGRRSGVHTRKT